MSSTLVSHQEGRRDFQAASSPANFGPKSQSNVSLAPRVQQLEILTFFLVRFAEQQPPDVDEDISFDDLVAHRDFTNVETTTESAGLVLVRAPSDVAAHHFSSPNHTLSPDEESSLTPTVHKETPRTSWLDQPQPLWPLRRNDEALLLQHFTKELCTWVNLPS
jgi:hypothetical protein